MYVLQLSVALHDMYHYVTSPWLERRLRLGGSARSGGGLALGLVLRPGPGPGAVGPLHLEAVPSGGGEGNVAAACSAQTVPMRLVLLPTGLWEIRRCHRGYRGAGVQAREWRGPEGVLQVFARYGLYMFLQRQLHMSVVIPYVRLSIWAVRTNKACDAPAQL